MTAHVNPPLTRRDHMLRIVERVARKHNVPVVDIMSRSRFREHVAARHEAIIECRRAFDFLSKPGLAKFFGLDHSTISYVVNGKRKNARRRGKGSTSGGDA